MSLLTLCNGAKSPNLGLHSKYLLSPTDPSFFPIGASNSTPAQSPAAKSVGPRYLSVPVFVPAVWLDTITLSPSFTGPPIAEEATLDTEPKIASKKLGVYIEGNTLNFITYYYSFFRTFLHIYIPAGDTLLDFVRSLELVAGDTAIGSFELILRRESAGVSGTGVVQVLDFFSLDNLVALEKTPCIGLH